jgi:hypothetical protein
VTGQCRVHHAKEELAMTAASNQDSVQTRLSRCQVHGVVEGTRKMSRLRFPFIITGVMRLAAMSRPFRCPECGTAAAKA